MKNLVKRGIGAFAGTNLGIRTLKPWQHDTSNIWITHYYGTPRVYLYDEGQDFSVSAFRANLRRAKSFFRFTTLSQLLEAADTRCVALTFDDGLDLEREGVLDVLSELQVPATFYLVTRCLDNKHLMWRHALFAMSRLRGPTAIAKVYGEEMQSLRDVASAAMSWSPEHIPRRIESMWSDLGMPPVDEFLDEHRPYFCGTQVEGLLSAGHEVGCHSASHFDCSLLSAEDLRFEIVDASRSIMERFQTGPISFAYPFGRRASESVEKACVAERDVTAILGTSGYSPPGTPLHRLERLDVEMDWNQAAYVLPGTEIALARLRK